MFRVRQSHVTSYFTGSHLKHYDFIIYKGELGSSSDSRGEELWGEYVQPGYEKGEVLFEVIV